jgi:hypothetical protein
MIEKLKIKYIRPTRRLLSERNIQIGISFLLLGLLSSLVLIVFLPDMDISLLLESIPSLVGSVAGVYISYSVISRHLMDTESDRINFREEVLREYDYDFPKVNYVDKKDDLGEIPTAFEYVPEQVRRLKEFEFEKTGDVYQLPCSVCGFLETEMDRLKQRFKEEGKFNWRKYRLEGVNPESGTLKVSETTYFRTFITNFSPDLGFEGWDDRTLREAFKNQTIRDKKVVPLSESPFSNHFGIGSFVIDQEGNFALAVRNKDVSVATNQLGLPISGSFDVDNFEGDSQPNLIKPKAREEGEMGLDDETIEASYSYLMGIVRRMEWLGKPDALSILIVDDIGVPKSMTKEYDDMKLIETEVEQIGNGTLLFKEDNARKVLRAIEESIEESGFDPTVGLLSWMLLFRYHSGIEPRDEFQRHL